MSQELEVIYDGEVVHERQELLQRCIDGWIEESSNIVQAKVRRAFRAFLYVQTRQADGLSGRQAVEEYGERVYAKKSTVYDAVRVITVFGHILSDPHSMLSKRVEAGLESFSQLVARTRAPDPIAELENPEIDTLSYRQIEAHYKEEKQKRAEEEYGPPPQSETQTCPRCQGEGVIPVG
jgi:hypothetical protein